MTTLTAASQSLFINLASDADNWGGQPLVDISASQRGNLTDLKKNGLLSTFRYEGCDFADFTDAGKALAAEHGIKI
jgi:hypothetical protein